MRKAEAPDRDQYPGGGGRCHCAAGHLPGRRWAGVIRMGITPGVLIVFIELTANIINPIQQMPEQLASRRAALALIDKLADALQDNVRDEGTQVPKYLRDGIELKNVSFCYNATSNVL